MSKKESKLYKDIFSRIDSDWKSLLGSVSFRLDKTDADDFVTVTGPGTSWKDLTVSCTPCSGVHTLYLVLTGNAELDSWQFNK